MPGPFLCLSLLRGASGEAGKGGVCAVDPIIQPGGQVGAAEEVIPRTRPTPCKPSLLLPLPSSPAHLALSARPL